jgi:hypothetical protein
MGYVDNLLARSERIVRVARQHWIVLLPSVTVDVAVSIVIIGLSALGVMLSPPLPWFALFLLIVPGVHLALRFWAWWSNQVILTNRRIVQVTGTFDKRVSDTLLEKVNDIVTEQSAWGRLLKFGDVEVISGSEVGTDVFRRLANPLDFKRALFDHRDAADAPPALDETMERVLSAEALSARDIPALILALEELRQNRLLSDTEFEAKKQALLAKI